MIQIHLLAADRYEALDGVPARLPDDGFVWIDAVRGHGRQWHDAVRALTGVAILDDHVADAENEQHPSYFDSTHAYEMIVFRGLAFEPPAHDDEPLRIATRPTVFFVLDRCLVTIRAGDSHTIALIRERLARAGAQQQRLPTRPEDLLLRMLNAMVDRYLDLRKPLTARLERWQHALLDPRRPFSDWGSLLRARMELHQLENLCEEQLDAVQEWRDARLESGAHAPGDGAPARAAVRAPPLGDLGDALRVRANDVAEHVQRVLNHVRRLESSAESAVQLHFSATAHRTSEIIRVLTVLTAVFMPLNLITGVFGMNFEFIPGLHSAHGFALTLLTMALIALAMLLYFRSRRYIGGPALAAKSRRRARGAARDAAAGDAQPADSAQTQST